MSIVSMNLLSVINGKSVTYRILVVSVHMGDDTLFRRSILRLLSSHGEPQVSPPGDNVGPRGVKVAECRRISPTEVVSD